MLTSKDLEEFIIKNRIDAEIKHLAVKTPTVETAAKALGVSSRQIIKSLLFLAKKEPVLVVAAGADRIDTQRLADHLGVKKRDLRLASPEKTLRLTGYPVGAMPPFGHKEALLTVVDISVAEHERLWAGGGEISAMMRMATADLLHITRAHLVDVKSCIARGRDNRQGTGSISAD